MACLTDEELIVKFDPSKLQKRRIIFHEPEKVPYVELPRARFSLSCSPQLPQYQLQRCVVPSNTPAPAGRPESLPFWGRSQGGRKLYSKLVYGAASVSSGEGEGFFILWGIWYPKEDIMRLAFANPTGWLSDKAFPFCEVYHYQHWDKQLFSDTALDSYHWIAKLAATVTKRDEIVKAVALSTPKSSVASCRQTLKLGKGGRKVHVVADISTREFLRRFMFQIDVTINPIQS